MFQGFYPRYDLEARIQHTKLDSGVWGIPSARMNRIEDHEGQDFKSFYKTVWAGKYCCGHLWENTV